MKGTIKVVLADRGFGFIRTERGRQLFFHASALARGDFYSLRRGQAVDFDFRRSKRGPLAANVRPREEEETLA